MPQHNLKDHTYMMQLYIAICNFFFMGATCFVILWKPELFIYSFQSTFEQSNRLEKCYQTILLTHHSRPAFRQNLIKAFETLNQTKGQYDRASFSTTRFDKIDNW